MSARLVQELAGDGVPVAVTCRVLGISRSGLYEAIVRAPSARAVVDQALTATIIAIHHGSRATYALRGSMPSCGWAWGSPADASAWPGGCGRRAWSGSATDRPLPAPHEDLVQRRITAEGPDRLWCTDITEHPTGTDLSRWSAQDLEAVAHALNTRPRKTLGWKTPAEALDEHLQSLQQAGVASTG